MWLIFGYNALLFSAKVVVLMKLCSKVAMEAVRREKKTMERSRSKGDFVITMGAINSCEGHNNNNKLSHSLQIDPLCISQAIYNYIPPELGVVRNLRHLLLYSNSLSGPIPPEFGMLRRLWVLRIGDNPLSGAIPAALVSCTGLEVLGLASYYRLNGSISVEFGSLRKLETLNL